MMPGSIIVKVELGGYKLIELKLSEAKALLKKAWDAGRRTRDVEETMRVLNNFDEFYRLQVKKNKSFLTPPKDLKEQLTGQTLVDKVRLDQRGEERFVTIVFDKRVSKDQIKELLSSIGYREIVFEK